MGRGSSPNPLYSQRHAVRGPVDGPFETEDGVVQYRRGHANGPFHRMDGPAVIVPAGVRWTRPDTWFVTGPAELWYRDGQLHRVGGPAVQEFTVDGVRRRSEYWQDGEVAPAS